MIIPKKIEEQTVEHFSPEGVSLGFLTYLESLDLQVQIKKHKASGYYSVFNDEKVEISSDGRYNTPKGMYDQLNDLLIELYDF